VCVTYLEGEGAKLNITGDDPEVEGEGVEDIEEVEERLGPRPVPGAP
jgi:hypothetical protein